MEYCKFQIGCLVVLLYVAFVYLRDSRKYHLRLLFFFYGSAD